MFCLWAHHDFRIDEKRLKRQIQSYLSCLLFLGFPDLRILPWCVQKVGRVLGFILGTSASESLSAAGNIFVGQVEAPLLIRPFMKDMTSSELHAIMTGGFATIAGTVFGIYVR